MHIEVWWFLVFGVAMSAIRMVQSITLALINRRKLSGPALTGELETRIARIEQIVESTSYEVERIGEAQRFLTKVLTDGRQGAPLAAPRRETSGSGNLS
jgi:hypothetical protein